MISVIHDSVTNTIEATVPGVSCRNYSSPQRDEMIATFGAEIMPFVEQAGWTDTYVANVIAAEVAAAVDPNTFILAQISALERAAITPRDTREMKIIWAEDKAIAMGTAADATFTLTQFNQTIQYYGLVLTAEQQDSVALGIVPAFTPQQSIDIAYATNVAYRLNVDLDNQIAALRAQLV